MSRHGVSMVCPWVLAENRAESKMEITSGINIQSSTSIESDEEYVSSSESTDSFDSELSTDSEDELSSTGSSCDVSSSSYRSSRRSNVQTQPTLSVLNSGLEEYETPLFEGSQVTVFDSYLLLYQFSLKHSLTKLAFQELIDLVNLHLPTARISTLYKLQKFFVEHFQLGKPISKLYCQQCHHLMKSGESTCPNECDTTTCRFVSVPIKQQVKRILESKLHVYKNLCVHVCCLL